LITETGSSNGWLEVIETSGIALPKPTKPSKQTLAS
jgi:hypothetical protein